MGQTCRTKDSEDVAL